MPETTHLRGGHETLDPRLDRLPGWDERNESYLVRKLGLPAELVARTWYLPRGEYVDQGHEGACVGAGITHELKASPIGTGVPDMTFAREYIYWPAQRADWWEGGSYPGATPFYEGTSVLHGLQAARDLGFFENFWWALTVDEALQALVHEGPLVIGVDWTEGQASPRPSGLVSVEGLVLGGHCVCVDSFSPKPRLRGETGLPPLVGIPQSWGPGHGDRGKVYLPVTDLEALLGEGGEIAVVTGRKRVRI